MARRHAGVRAGLGRLVVCATLGLGACAERSGGDLEVVAVTPSTVRYGQASSAVIEGRNLHNDVRVSLDGDGSPVIDRSWQVYIDAMPLGDAAVQYVSTRELAIVIPGGLALGLHDVRVVSPGGDSDRLSEAFTVVPWGGGDGGAAAGGTPSVNPVAGAAGFAAGGAGGTLGAAGGAGAGRDAGGAPAMGGFAGGEAGGGLGGRPDTAGAAGTAGGGLSGAGGEAGAGGAAGYGTSGGAGGVWSGGAAGSSGAEVSPGGRGGVGGSVIESVTPPVAYFTVTPGGGSTVTEFQFNASRSWDQEEPDDTLDFAWDWDSDGAFDDYGLTAVHTFPNVGKYRVRLQVTDSGQGTDTYERILYVFDPAHVLVVNTALDVTDSDSGTTTLREAIGMATGSTTETVIHFERPMDIVLESGLPTLAGEVPTHLFGSPGVVVDGSAVSGDCLQVFADGSSIVGLEVFGCGRAAVRVDAAAAWIGSSVLRDSETGLELWGPAAYVVDNDIGGNSAFGIDATGADHLLQGNRIHDNEVGIELRSSAGTRLVGNLIYAQTAEGISVSTGVDRFTVWHNTVDSNGGSGLLAHVNASGLDVRNNAFTGNAIGVEADSGALARLERNLYFANSGGDCVGCAPGADAVLADAQYVAPVRWDLRIVSDSPAVDAGADLGFDANGSELGLFNGIAPDIGAWESP